MNRSEFQGYVSAVFNLMNAILGSGIVGLPFALANLGYVTFPLALLFVAILALFTINLLLKSCELHKTSSYEALASLAFGKPGLWYTCFVIFMHTMIAMCTYMFIVMYEGPAFVRGIIGQESTCENLSAEGTTVWYLEGKVLAVMVLWIVVMPLAVAKNIDFLGKTSAIGMLAMIVFSIMIVVYKFIIKCPVNKWSGAEEFFKNYGKVMSHPNCTLDEVYQDYELEFWNKSDHQTCEAKAAVINSHSIYAIPTMLFAFQCHASSLPVYAELQDRTRMKMMKVAIIAVFAVLAIYCTTSYFAYFTWYDLTMEEVLMMYSSLDASDPKILIARGCLLTCVIFSTPLLHYPCRKAQTNLIWGDNVKFSWIRHIGLMIINLTLVSLVVCFVPGIQTLFGYGGAITANSLEIILPCLFFYRVGPDDWTFWKSSANKLDLYTPDKSKSKLKIACLIIGILGIMLMIGNTILISIPSGH